MKGTGMTRVRTRIQMAVQAGDRTVELLHVYLSQKSEPCLKPLVECILICSVPAQIQGLKSLSRVRLFATTWTVASQAPPSMGFSRQEYWSGVPFPSPGEPKSKSISKSSFNNCAVNYTACQRQDGDVSLSPGSHTASNTAKRDFKDGITNN